jgi:hypothetical protein
MRVSDATRPTSAWRITVNVTAAARSIGLVRDDGREVHGTIDEDVVLKSISSLATAHPGNDDLFADAAMRVQLARSAGVVQPDPTSVLYRSRTSRTLQLRYRSEMADVFTDLAIDVGLRGAERFADTPA